jgi:GH43 family beta-xylosidase
MRRVARARGLTRFVYCVGSWALIGAGGAAAAAAAAPEVFVNPLLPSGPDPWVVRHAGFYYYTNTLGDRIALWRTPDITRLRAADVRVIWRPPAHGADSAAIWAPELHWIRGRWFLYFTASDRAHNDDAHRHIFVLENAAPDPLQGHWIERGMLRTRYPGIDPTEFSDGGRLYFVYSAYVGSHSDLIIALMRNPWTLSSRQVDIGQPTEPWEMRGGRRILEGPEFLAGRRGQRFLVYSASACWSDQYALGMLTAARGTDLLDPRSWAKSPAPVFHASSASGVYATGHNGFFQSPDGKEDWIIYHANSAPHEGCGKDRSPRIQRFTWRPDGTPDFGTPVATGVTLHAPGGTPKASK